MSEPIRKLTMPKWGLAMREGTIVAWLVPEGQAFTPGDEVVEIETEKVNNVYEVPFGGVLRRHVAPVGATVPIGGLIGVIADDAASDAEIDAFVAQFEADFEPEAAAAEPSGPQRIDVGGRRISQLLRGEGEATPLVMVHGFGGDLTTWLFNQPDLAETRPVVSLDLPGHGASDKDVGAGDIALLADTVVGTMDTLGVARAHLAGHSLGGAIVLELALAHPDRVASVTLVCPAGLGREIAGDFIADFIAADRRKAARTVLERLVDDPATVSRDMVEYFLRYKRTDGVVAALNTIAAAVFDADGQRTLYAERLDDLAVPILCIWGASDRVVPAHHAAALPAVAAVHTIDGAGHLVHMEKASAVNALIAEFLAAA